MANSGNYEYTQEEYDELYEKLKTTVKERDLVDIKLESAVQDGDLKENSDFDTARDAKNRLQNIIEDLEDRIQNCDIIEIEETEDISRGSYIKVKVSAENEEDYLNYFKIVGAGMGEAERGVNNNIVLVKISTDSPMVKNMINKRNGSFELLGTDSKLRVYNFEKIDRSIYLKESVNS